MTHITAITNDRIDERRDAVAMGSVWPFRCGWCGARGFKAVGAINRANKAGAGLYCDRRCAGLARRDTRTKEEKVAAKAAYDAEYRKRDVEAKRAAKAAWYQRTRDPVKEAEKRKAKMPRHVEYCRRPEYRKWKADYDQKYRAGKLFGPFGEAAILLNQLHAEITSRASWTEIRAANGTLNKHQQRRRDYDKAFSG